MNGSPGQSAAQKRPKVLFISTELWLSTARQVMVFASMGCEVTLLSPPAHPAMVTGAVSTFCKHDPLRPVRCIRSTIAACNPDAVIPADERTVIHLQELWSSAESHNTFENCSILQLLQRSLGSREALFAARSRMHVLQLATEQGVEIPETVCVDSEEEIGPAIEKLGLPLVLKADMTSGGDGVHIVRGIAEAKQSWRKLHYPPNIARVIRRGVLFKNWAHLRSWVKREALSITAQKFVEGGIERTSTALCHNGQVVASTCLEVAKTWQVRGPSSVLRIVCDAAMQKAMEKIAARLNLSGFCGFDFMLTQQGRALLIEINPRPTQTAHLALGPGRDLIAAYVRCVLGHTVPDRAAMTSGETVALFPQELIRDANSDFAQSAFHDVPWESPELMRRALSPLPSLITDDPRWQAAVVGMPSGAV